MKILVYGDIHFHPWQADDRPDRWEDCLSVLRDVRSLAYKHAVDAVVFLGDLFENKRLLRADIAGQAYTQLQRPLLAVRNGKREIVPMYAIAGNHDYYKDACTLEPLRSLRDKRHVFTAGTPAQELSVQAETGERLLFLPYGINLSDMDAEAMAATRYDAVFMHGEIEGTALNNGIQSERTDVPGWVFGMAVDVFVNGHYHTPGFKQVNDRSVYMCGAPLQHHWGDADETKQRGVALLTLETGKKPVFTRILIGNNYPKFYTTKTADTRETDFVLAQETAVTVTADEQRKYGDVIASGTHSQMVAGYIKQRIPDLAEKGKFAKYYKTGLALLKGD